MSTEVQPSVPPIDRARGVWHGLRKRLESVARSILFLLAETEAIRIRPGMDAPWRRRQFKRCGVVHGERFYAGRGLWLMDGSRFRFGERCSLGEFARIMDHGPIAIGSRVWCGANVTIVAGASIGDDVVIGAGSLVRDPIPSGSVAAGVPARVIRKLERNEPLAWRLP